MKVWTAALVVALCAVGASAKPALAANLNTATAKVAPRGAGSASDPLPIAVGFSLRSRNEDAANRPLPTKTYVLGMEGVTAYPGLFPSCSIAKLKARKGPPSTCAKAQIGSGTVKGAAGIVEDETMDKSVPCNLKMRLYNMGNGIALRLDGDPPLPKNFKSTKIGCPVPIHTAIPAPFRKTTMEGLPSTELQFTVPKLLMRPLVGWNSGLMVVDANVEKQVAKNGKGYLTSTACRGGTRTIAVGFIGADGNRADVSAEPAC